MYKWLIQLRLRFSYRRPSVLHIALCWIFGLLIGIFFALMQGFDSSNIGNTYLLFTYSYGGFALFSISGILLAYLFLFINRLLFYIGIFIRALLQAYCFIFLCVNFNASIGFYILFSPICNSCILLFAAFLCAEGATMKSVFCPTIIICALFSIIHLLLL